MLSAGQMADVREFARRRVAMFLYVLTVIVFPTFIPQEAAEFTHVVDDYATVVLALVAIVFYVAMWRKPVQSIRTANKLATILAVLIILVTIYAVTQEIADPADFGNEIPTIILGGAIIANGVL